ncbi:helix-turn-helix transcriptional regulator [Streptomyces sp. ME18-1-4]|uniref:helix-turn-helix domain-containing protein n=1 Tax=Streptomyces sp. ME18-1-4 TaxID=3028685 RepID=UPI0029AD329C|nr:helix-turn-helix transcriptional regulator [Streptomyces sp. ME18-1-4]MDX3244770.1 helix-turn-helix transcriptional regulator [Streptomyces sp. ME18-1-4]
MLFGELLRHFREGALLTQEALAQAIPCDRSLVARVEAGTRVPQEPFAKKCDEVLETGGALARLWVRVDWYGQVEHPDWFKQRAEMDGEAVSLREYQERVMPGMLQTPEYAHALFSRVASGIEVDERVRARLSRQQRFLADDGPLYVVVLDESCLRHMVGGPEIMRDQCAYLLSVGRRPNIRVQVAPAHYPELLRPNVSMSLIELPDGHRWVYSESVDRGHFNDDPAVFTGHSHAYDVLRADSLSARESAVLIGDAMEGYGRHGQSRTRRGDLDQEQLQRRERRQLPRSRHRIHLRRPRP